MAVAKNKMHPDVHNVENWKYTTTNNFKTFHSKDEAKRFIVGTSKIWKLENYTGGITFTQKLLESVDVIQNDIINGFEYVDDKGDACYILFLMRASPDGRSLHISHTQKKLSRSGARKHGIDYVQVEECNAFRWLMGRAWDELHLPEHMKASWISQQCNALEYGSLKPTPEKRLKLTLGKRSLSVTETDQYFGLNNSTLPNERCIGAPKSMYEKRFLSAIPNIAEFCKDFPESEEFLEELSKKIQNVGEPEELLYQLDYPNGEKCTLTLLLKPETNRIHMLVVMRSGGEVAH